MNYSSFYFEGSLQFPDPTLLPGQRREVDVGPALPLMSNFKITPPLAPAPLQYHSVDLCYNFTRPSEAPEQRFPLFPSVQACLPPATFPMAANTLSVNMNPPMPSYASPDPSEISMYGTEEASRGNQAFPADSTQFIASHQGDKVRPIFPATTVSVSPGGQVIPANLHPLHVIFESWHLMCWNAIIVNGPRKFVPQIIYQPRSQGDKERYVSLAKIHPPIIFRTKDSPEWGVDIPQLLSKQLTPLIEGNQPAFASCGPSIVIRVNWPGYQPFHKKVSTRDYTPEHRRISKAKLAKIVARCVQHFMDIMSKQTMRVGSDRQWRVGPLNIRVEDIVLVSLHHVSQGSWQPQLRLRRTVGGETVASAQQNYVDLDGTCYKWPNMY